MSGKFVSGIGVTLMLAGCAASVDIAKIKLESGRVYEVAKTRSGVEFADCGTQLVSYLFDEKGTLVDSKSERGRALHCGVIETSIEAGSRVGSAALIARGMIGAAKATGSGVTNITNQQSQGQGQEQGQYVTTTSGQGGEDGQSGGQGNNGNGNGTGDGGNAGTDNHHDNGDNN